MAVKIRLARHGAKKRPFYRIVVADSEAPRDGRFLETVGTYNPLRDPAEIAVKQERVQYWLDQGAQPTDRIARMLEAAGVKEKTERKNMKKAEPGEKAKARAAEKAEKAAAPAEEPAEAPAEEPVAEEPAEETSAE